MVEYKFYVIFSCVQCGATTYWDHGTRSPTFESSMQSRHWSPPTFEVKYTLVPPNLWNVAPLVVGDLSSRKRKSPLSLEQQAFLKLDKNF